MTPHDAGLIRRALALGGTTLVASIGAEAAAAADRSPHSEHASTYREVWRRRLAEHEHTGASVNLLRH